jgi:ABC-type taurine transport system substrate-binding protein
MQDMAIRERQGVNIFESIPDFFSTIASGATPIGSAGSAPDKVAVIRVMHALEHIIDYLVKR